MVSFPLRSRIQLCILLLLPMVVYGAMVFHEYGLRDDYSITREAHEEPGKVLAFTASHGRPLYGHFLDFSYSRIGSLQDLAWLRLASVFLLTCFIVLLWRQLRVAGWSGTDAMVVALMMALLPAAQVTVSWAVGWPWGFSLIFAVLGFVITEAAFKAKPWLRLCYLSGALLLYMAATSIYQSNTLFVVVLMAATLLSPVPPARPNSETWRWFVSHLAILVTGLLLSYGLLLGLFAEGIFQASARLQFETDPVSKLPWFFYQPLPNALSFLALRDDFNTGVIPFCLLLLSVIALIATAIYKQSSNAQRLHWLLCVLVLPWVAHSISLVAAERALGYRTLFALSGLVVILFFAALREVFAVKIRQVLQLVLIVVASLLAGLQSYFLIAVPQGREWQIIRDAVAVMPVTGNRTEVFLIEPKPADRSTRRSFRDEFGSLTSNSEWAPTEIFKTALRQRFPDGLPKGWSYEFDHGGEPPPANEHYDQLIDMRTLKQWREAE